MARRKRWQDLPYSLDGFRLFCRELKLENGKPFALEEHEVEIVRDHFDGARRVVIIIGKKNGKTTLFGALGLYHLAKVGDANVLIGAASRDQATILFDQAAGLVRRSGLENIFKVQKGYRRMHLLGEAGELRVLAGDVDTADGQIPTLSLIDELHRHRSAELTTTLYLGLVPRDGQQIVISTAGANIDSPLGRMRDAAHALPSFTRDYERKKNYAKSEDGSLVWHEWCLVEPEDDVEDMEVVKKANPASWHTIKSLTEFRGGVSEWEWRRFACGIWTEGEEPWLEPHVWDALANRELERIDPLEEVIVGVDLGLKQQDTGITIVANRDGVYVPEAVILHPPVGLGQVEDEMRRIKSEYNVLTVVYDPTNFEHSAVALEDEGLVMSRVPQSAERMAGASATLLSVIQAGELAHNGDGALRAHVLAGATKQYERGWRLVKDPRTRRSIGALVAMAMAIEEWQGVSSEPLIASM